MYCRFCRERFKPWENPNPQGDLRKCRTCEGIHFREWEVRYCWMCGKELPQYPKMDPDGKTIMITGSRELCEQCNPFTGKRSAMLHKKLEEVRERIKGLFNEEDEELRDKLFSDANAIINLLQKLTE